MALSIRFGVALLLCGSLCSCSESPAKSPPNKAASSQHATHAGPGAAAVLAPAGAQVSFVSPSDGATVKGPLVEGKVTVSVKMGVSGIEVRPAGEQVKGTGHHHIIIDGAGIPLGDVVPKDETHLHYGQGQTDAEVQLTPGSHKLTLQFADGAHLSYGPQLSRTIKVNVQAE